MHLHNKPIAHVLAGIAAALALTAPGIHAAEASYPAKSITIVVPASPAAPSTSWHGWWARR
ncbi:hypothetical protein ACU4HD_31275 [Cupriavidus basilensis]